MYIFCTTKKEYVELDLIFKIDVLLYIISVMQHKFEAVLK